MVHVCLDHVRLDRVCLDRVRLQLGRLCALRSGNPAHQSHLRKRLGITLLKWQHLVSNGNTG